MEQRPTSATPSKGSERSSSGTLEKPERIRGDTYDLTEEDSTYIYFADEMDPYIEQLKKQLAAFEDAYTGGRPPVAEALVDQTPSEDWPRTRVDWSDLEECFIVTHAEEPGSVAKMRTRTKLAKYMAEFNSVRDVAQPSRAAIDSDARCARCGHFFCVHNGDRCFSSGCSCSEFSAPAEGVTDGV